MIFKIFPIFIFTFLSVTGYSQKNKSIDIGISAPLSIDSRIPGIALTPNINYCFSRHQIQIGLDIYGNNRKPNHKIVGPHMAYKYLLRDETKRFNLFFDFNLQYVQFGSGLTLAVPYNYLPTDDKKGYNLIQTKSLINTLGIGISVIFLKRASFVFVLGGGYNYYKSKYSPTYDDPYFSFSSMVSENAKPIVYSRLGLNFKIWKNP